MASNSEESSSSSDHPWSGDNKSKFQAKAISEYYDPCQEAASRSIKCLHRNGGDRTMCGDYFQAYRDCKKQWLEKRKAERKKNSLW
ncbi:hypothetical protein SAPIO_CDS0649 [Scedosporium apiospermum]|uniref:CHCH domain-containing protein n=1 Tax=Pseudallescheria apiosperma TaxID=563466 RepID=A0A084GG82_PSEDA|nr:uncharacterized protein SAPIO_CDS0649 [Scedosporium apiospermum]KEZ46344.1 hypothetical protein SAPIO_CDS0649 [Scedosporium apiospermum]